MAKAQQYKSGAVHDELQAREYSQTHELPHRYIAYRDFPRLIKQYKDISRVLDLGSGSGFSSIYLHDKGYEVIGTDKSQAMINEAKLNFSYINFIAMEHLHNQLPFDLVFSSFVLFELARKEEIVEYLNLAASCLREDGIFYGITGSECLHDNKRDWECFSTKFSENSNPSSGDIVKIKLSKTNIEFSDYYWTENDFRECFESSDLELIDVHYPLGDQSEPYDWNDELIKPLFVIFIAKKSTK
jgi:SAM-dependent methyltransferase